MIVRDVDAGGRVEMRFEDGRAHRERVAEGDPGGGWAGRGWVDVQVNGFGGHDVNRGALAPDAFEAMTRLLHAEGVARYLPTVVPQPLDALRDSLRGVARAREASPWVARAVPGIHLEGPFLSPEEGARGAHPVAALRAPDRDLADDLQAAADGTIRLATLAPELPGALELIAHLVSLGVVVAIGHTTADETRIREAVDAGARLSTHLGNGIPATLPRHQNPIWPQLADDRLTASAIFDGHHLTESVMRVFWKAKAPDRLILTSDAVALAGMPPGVYEGQVGGDVELHPDGRLTVPSGEYLAGSASSLLDGVRTAVLRLGLPPERVLPMVGRLPAELLGLPDAEDRTVVEIGPDNVDPVAVVVDGSVVWRDEGRGA
jgi:N-acetylglucosamine-6-phosphate deacetylase